MGQDIRQSTFEKKDFSAFSAKLSRNLTALHQILERPSFGGEPPSLGAELEFYLIDQAGRPLCSNKAVQKASADPRVTLELNQYNLEYNYDPIALSNPHGENRSRGNHPFSQLSEDILSSQQTLNRLAAEVGGSVLPIGILPTLTEHDLGPQIMTDLARYRALSDILLSIRGGKFAIDIEGDDSLHLKRRDLTLEGTCTSFQIHYNFPLNQFVDTWNAMTLITPLVLAISTNSPILLGKRLWHETRVPLFKQSTDSRSSKPAWHDLPRVELGYDWLRQSVHELFAQRVYLYPPLIPLCHEEDPEALLATGTLPGLHELCLHSGTIWHWNRPVYCNQGAGHMRIEMRSLPAGPTAIDMAANAAFYIGLATGLVTEINDLLPAIPFKFVTENFYTAARNGIDAQLIWPSLTQNRLGNTSARDLVLQLLPTADKGLQQLGINQAERGRLLQIIENRVVSGQNGSSWLLRRYDALRTGKRQNPLQNLVFEYRDNNLSNQPVAEWSLK